MSNSPRQPRFSVGHPVKRGAVTLEPVVPLDGPVTDRPLIHVRHPLKRGALALEAITASVHLRLPLIGGADGERMFQTLHAVIGKVNEVEALFGRAGVWVDGELSGVQDGAVVVVLAPNDPTDGVETCKRVADYLFAAARKGAGVTVTVFAAEQPETPVYELAA